MTLRLPIVMPLVVSARQTAGPCPAHPPPRWSLRWETLSGTRANFVSKPDSNTGSTPFNKTASTPFFFGTVDACPLPCHHHGRSISSRSIIQGTRSGGVHSDGVTREDPRGGQTEPSSPGFLVPLGSTRERRVVRPSISFRILARADAWVATVDSSVSSSTREM